jgi:hypothetical protein
MTNIRINLLKKLSSFKDLITTEATDSKILTRIGFDGFEETDDGLFYRVTLPAGWSVRQDEKNPFLNHFIDKQERKRLFQLYKGSGLNELMAKNRYIYLVVRESDRGSYIQYKKGEPHIGIVVDQGDSERILWQSSPLILSENKPWAESMQLRNQAVKWLDTNYPNHRDFFAYW